MRVLLLLLPLSLAAATYYVKPGDPLQAAIDRLAPGDTLVFVPGEYRQGFVLHTSGVTLDGQGARFCGLRKLDLKWEPQGRVLKAKVDHPAHQLFLDEEILIPARWPNMTFAERWDNSKWPAAAKGTKYGVMVDPELKGQDFTGCVAILNIGAWQTFRRVIESHTDDRFTYSTKGNVRLHHTDHPVGMDRYCIYGKAALDAPGERYYDAAESALYIIPLDGVDLRKLESKVMAEAIVLDGVSNVVVNGFRFLATTIRLRGASDCLLHNLSLIAPSTIANPFGPNLPYTSEEWNARTWFGETSVDSLFEIGGDRITLHGVEVRHAEGPGLTVIGDQPVITNCVFADNDWNGLDYGFGIDLLASTNPTFRKSRLSACGGSEGLRLPNHSPALVEYNELKFCGLRQSDGAIVQTSTAGCRGTVIRYNNVHDHKAFYWGGNGIRSDDGGRGLHVHHNVVWNCSEKGIVLKGDDHHVHHNICFDNDKIDILIPRNRLPGKPRELVEQNHNTRVYSNQGKVQGNWSWEPATAPFCEVRNPLPPPDAAMRERYKTEYMKPEFWTTGP